MNRRSVPITVRRWIEYGTAAARETAPLLLLVAMAAFITAYLIGLGTARGNLAANLAMGLSAAALIFLVLDRWVGASTERKTNAALRSEGVPAAVAAVAAPLMRPSARYSGREIGESVAGGYRFAARVADPLTRTPSVEVTWGRA